MTKMSNEAKFGELEGDHDEIKSKANSKYELHYPNMPCLSIGQNCLGTVKNYLDWNRFFWDESNGKILWILVIFGLIWTDYLGPAPPNLIIILDF